jgi:hypothetical protein
MSVTKPRTQPEDGKSEPPLSILFRDLDRMKLKKEIAVKGRTLSAGLTGTVVFCYGAEAYEVEFPGIKDFFQIPSGYLERDRLRCAHLSAPKT